MNFFRSIIASLISNPVLVNILMVLILFVGILSGNMMIKEFFPVIALDKVEVSVKYPGASPSVIEKNICIKLEEAVDGIDGIDDIRTEARPNIGILVADCSEGADIRKVKDDIENRVDAITSFPKGAERPVIEELEIRQRVLSIMLWGDISFRELKYYARKIKDELQGKYGLSQIVLRGAEDDEISIEIPERSLVKYHITFAQLKRAVAKNNFDMSLGRIKGDREEIAVRINDRKYFAKDYKNIPLLSLSDGRIIRLGDLGSAIDTFNEDDQNIIQYNGHRAIMISIFKKEGEDAVKIAKKIDDYIASKKLPPSLHLTKVLNSSRFIVDRLNMLKNNGIMGLILVILILWLFLDLRLSFWVAMGIPISIAGSLAIMWLFGYSLNMITMFGLIMVLGLIVDDAIVVGESIYNRRINGEGPLEAAIGGVSEVALPVIASVLTTIVAFLPLFFVNGIMGKFIKNIPVPVVSALSISLIEGLFILPVHLRHLDINRREKVYLIKRTISSILDKFINNFYGPLLIKCLKIRYVIVSISIMTILIIAGLYRGGFIKFVFFPQVDEDYITAVVELNPGTSIKRTKTIAEHILKSWNRVEKPYEKIGKSIAVGKITMIGATSGWKSKKKTNILEVKIELIPSEIRNVYFKRLLAKWRKEVGIIPDAVYTRFSGSRETPGGRPIEISLMGDNIKDVYNAAKELVNRLKLIKGVYDVGMNYRKGMKELNIVLKPEAYYLGLTTDDILTDVYTAFYGNEILRVQRGRDEVKIKLRYPETYRKRLEQLKHMRLVMPDGRTIPMMEVVTFSMKEGPTQIKRKNKERVIVVSCDLDGHLANAEEIINDFKKGFLKNLSVKYGISYGFEGDNKDKNDTMKSLILGFPIALFMIYFIIAALFKSYLQPIIVMFTVPFGLIGAIIGHILLGFPITIMSVFGMVALSGIVVHDAIVLIEGINFRLEKGTGFFKSIVLGGKRRFRAIILTTLTTFFGLMPLIMEKSMQAQFLIPMAISIAFGVLFATLITLFLIPCFFTILNDIKRVFYFLWNGILPSREFVEPRVRNRYCLDHKKL